MINVQSINAKRQIAGMAPHTNVQSNQCTIKMKKETKCTVNGELSELSNMKLNTKMIAFKNIISNLENEFYTDVMSSQE